MNKYIHANTFNLFPFLVYNGHRFYRLHEVNYTTSTENDIRFWSHELHQASGYSLGRMKSEGNRQFTVLNLPIKENILKFRGLTTHHGDFERHFSQNSQEQCQNIFEAIS